MTKIINLPKTLRKNQENIDEDSFLFKTIFHDKLIGFPSEFKFYLRKYKRVYKIEKSNSGLNWVLTVDDGTYGPREKGIYVRRLKGFKFLDALNDAIKKLPEEVCFFSEEGSDFKTSNTDVNEWLDKNLQE